MTDVRDWRGKKVVIIGAARQGLALARYLVSHGAVVLLNDRRAADEMLPARQSLADLSQERLEWIFGGHPIEVLDGADLLCPSGGVSLSMPLVVEARQRGIALSNDSQIFLEAAPCKVIGITGSAGKTTTTTIVGRIASKAEGGRMKDEGRWVHRSWVGGNIGAPLIAHVDEMTTSDLAVMELSSFQLELVERSPQVAAILNITPNHLDRHDSMEAYTAAKSRILQFQWPGNAAVLGREDPGAWALAGMARGRLLSFGKGELPAGQDGTFCRDEALYLRYAGEEAYLMPRSSISLRGEHNLLNVLAACAIAAAAGLPVEAMRAGVEGFVGVPHRLEFVRRWNGAAWYNDSKATSPREAIASIRSFDEPLVLLAGGQDKNLPWDEFALLVRQRVDHVILFGEAAEKIGHALEAAPPDPSGRPYSVERAKGLQQAIQAAAKAAQSGYVILLAPGGTSFDEFRDFEDRGEAFRKWVMSLP